MPQYYLGSSKPEFAMKHMTMIYYGDDADEAKDLAKQIRTTKRNAQLRDGTHFAGDLEEKVDVVVISPSLRSHLRDPIELVYRKHTQAQIVSDRPLDELAAEISGREVQVNAPKSAVSTNGNGLPSFQDLTNKEIRDWATDKGIALGPHMNKAELVAEITRQVGSNA